MDNLKSFHTLLELVILILTLSSQSPWLGVIAIVGALLCLFIDDDVFGAGDR